MKKVEVSAERARRAEILEAARQAKMARSAHAFVRGNTAKFYEWLASAGSGKVPAGPPIWICGDCHLGNLGPLADSEGKVDVQIRDLDQTVIGNPAHDLIRLGLSLASAARGSDLPGVTTARMMAEMVSGYSLALRDRRQNASVPEPSVVKSVRRQALGRKWGDLARERIGDVKPKIPLGRRFWALSDQEREAVKTLFAVEPVRDLLTQLNARSKGSTVKVVDAAYWMKGCSSLGKLRYAVLIELVEKRRRRGYALVDLKEAVRPAAPTAKGADMPTHNGERVVAGARALSPNLGDRMMSVDLLGRPMVLRELMPEDLKLEIDQFSRDEAVMAAKYLSFVVGHAHARQMDRASRQAWRRELDRHHPKTLDAPSWLWTTVVRLISKHEESYLEHCRRYALKPAA
jgi:uncharacterized protein (DUF2252 family)